MLEEPYRTWYIRFWLLVCAGIVFWLIGIDEHTQIYSFSASFWGMTLCVIPLFNGVYSLAILKNNIFGVDISRPWRNKAIWYFYLILFFVWLFFFDPDDGSRVFNTFVKSSDVTLSE